MSVAPARKPATEGIHTSLLPSACTVDSVATHNRVDPYWDKLWAPGSVAVWSTGSMERTLAHTDPSRANRRFMMKPAEAKRLLNINQGRASRLAAWSIVDSWRTATAEQVAALSGSELLLDPACSNIAASASLDLLDVGSFPSAIHRNPGLGRRSLYRPGRSDTFERDIKPTLTWPEWVSVTGGTDWSSGGQYDRHNVLATELAIRAAEYLPIGSIMGEKFATVDLLAGTGLGRTVKKADNRRADGVIVRQDGMRIAFELTATASASFENKVRRWAEILTERPLETSGLTILFVAVAHPDRLGHKGKDPRNEIYRRIAKVLSHFPGKGPNSAAARIGVAAWDDWFPARHEVSESFLKLTANFPTASGRGAGRWVPRSLLDDYDFTPWETFDATAVNRNAPLLAATPHWMRKGDHTALLGDPMTRAGERVPVPGPARPEAVSGRAFGESSGAAAPMRLPSRLRVEGH